MSILGGKVAFKRYVYMESVNMITFRKRVSAEVIIFKFLKQDLLELLRWVLNPMTVCL